MKKILALLLLSGCTVSVVDSRLTREEIAEAFKQRDQAIFGLTKLLNDMKKEAGEKK